MQNSPEIKECFDWLHLNQKHLSSSQFDFVRSLKKYFMRNKQLTERQSAALLEIKKYLKVDETVRVTNKQ